MVKSEKDKKQMPNVVIHLSSSDTEGWDILKKAIKLKSDKKSSSKTA